MKNIVRKQPKLIKVCAWCPKAYYPQLAVNEEYTHGMCLKHYKQLSLHKQIPLKLYISTFIEKMFLEFFLKNLPRTVFRMFPLATILTMLVNKT